jgi:hypothetical protein
MYNTAIVCFQHTNQLHSETFGFAITFDDADGFTTAAGGAINIVG